MNLVRFQPRQGYTAPAREDASHPYQPLSRLHNDIDRLFQGFFGDFPTPFGGLRDMFSSLPDFLPSLDLKSDASTYTLSLELPGVAPEEVKVELNNGMLSISGEKKQEESGKDASQHVQERCYGSFSRSMSLPEDADVEHISASHKDGVLTILIPRKAPEKPQSRAITVTRG
ncbi:Hsp20/alpha crystallin family protein [uncultured Desulfovibrio sp.]|uniref:Hsp20/alpha crystallin family protein n=1 Tax=uncultured Desulfovibrio sp. TaxID=167968 RepID=UPI00263677C3|nr:Hsp20/alpha crystallin family protein [uncultured Desulfovibrio sp.]